MRLIFPLLGLACLTLPVLAQVSETGGDSDDGSAPPLARRALPAGPDAAQDEEAAREKLLKAADQIDSMESNSEANKVALEEIKTQVTKLQDDNTTLKQQVSTLQDTIQKQQDTLDRMQAEHAKERQALIDEVSSMVAEKAPHKTHHPDADETVTPRHDADDSVPPVHHRKAVDALSPPPEASTSGPTNPPDTAGAGDASGPAADPAPSPAAVTPTETPHPRKGYMYVVKSHETLSLIVDAYRDQGVKVTVAEVRKANGLSSASKLKVGQKLFIPNRVRDMSDLSETTELQPVVADVPAPEGENDPTMIWRVKKLPDGSIYGPVDEPTLKEWANAAQISPEDLIDNSDDNWVTAPQIEFLGMIWVIKLPGDEIYGPTSIGTLREFIAEGLLTDKSIATNVMTTQSLPIGALFAALDFEKKRALRRAAPETNKSTLMINIDMAKDQRIRQLEEDLRSMRKEHEALVHKYRQLTLEMQAVPRIVQPGAKPRIGR